MVISEIKERVLTAFPYLLNRQIVLIGSALVSSWPKDIDVMLVNYPYEVKNMRQTPTVNRFGGAKYHAFDVFRLEDAQCFKDNPILKKTIQNFVNCIPEGYPQIAFDCSCDVLLYNTGVFET